MNGKKRVHILGLMSALLIGCLLVSHASAAAEPYAVLLSWESDPASTITAAWRDAGKETEFLEVVAETDYHKTGFDAAHRVEAECRDISLDGSGAWHYEATVTGLEADTVYCYRVGNEAFWSETRSFKTDAPDAEAVTFAYFGDPQTAGDMEEDYSRWEALVRALYERTPELAFGILGGDLVNSGISVQQFDAFFRHAEPVFSGIPLFSAVGNHESNFIGGKPELFLDCFAFPRNGPKGFAEELYSFNVGNCHLLILNDWIFSGEQGLTEEEFDQVNDWLAADLAASTADWQIVVLHVPVYELHGDSTAVKVREVWEPIFDRYGVDLVLEGHQHVYSRSYPMLNGRVDYENGIPYVMGVSGSKFYDSADETFAERTVYEISNCQLIRSDGKTLTLQCMDSAGNELDYAMIRQRDVRVSRAEYLETLWRAAGSPEPEGSSPFIDTADEAIIWGYEQGLILGYGNGRFGPEDPIEDWQIRLILSRR